MPVVTVLGDVEPESLGIIVPHEHILLDAWSSIVEKRNLSEKREISNKNLYYI